MSSISANDLKTKGVSVIEAELAHYHYLRECELEAALAETRADMASGRFVKESAAEHLARLNSAE